MDIAELAVNDAIETEGLFRLQEAVHAADEPDNPPPLRQEFLTTLRQPRPDVRMERLVARVDGELVGGGALMLPDADNRHLAAMDVQVHPAYRRRGVGRALFDQVRQRARDERRQALVCGARTQVPGGPARSDAGYRFLAAMGFARALQNSLRRIDLAAIDEAAEQRLLDDCLAHAAEYECLSWTGTTPDELADGVARVGNRLNADAPTGELALEETTMDAERLHADERWALDRHAHLVGVAARHRATGEVAAFTKIEVRSIGDHGSVWLTIADPRHRGHRLGTIVKIECHRLVRRSFPNLRYVSTGNADANAHMVAINERLGFVVYEAGTMYQLTL